MIVRLLKQITFYFTRRKNFNEVKSSIKPLFTRISAMPWWSVRYYGYVDNEYRLMCEGADGTVIMGIPLELCYNIQIEREL